MEAGLRKGHWKMVRAGQGWLAMGSCQGGHLSMPGWAGPFAGSLPE